MNLKMLIKNRDIKGIRLYCKEHNLHIKDGKIVPKDEDAKKKLIDKADFYNQRQQARKILLG